MGLVSIKHNLAAKNYKGSTYQAVDDQWVVTTIMNRDSKLLQYCPPNQMYGIYTNSLLQFYIHICLKVFSFSKIKYDTRKLIWSIRF